MNNGKKPNEKEYKSNISKNKKSKKAKKHRTVKRVFLTILLILIIAIAIFAYKVIKNGGGMKGIVTTVIGSSADKTKTLEDMYVLCMGKSQNMTDTIMVVKYSPQTQQASMLSIPRDSFVGKNKQNATAWDKINAKYQISPQSTIDAVNSLTGLNIKYYFTVDTKALRDLVDAIGGVYFDVPIDMDYDDSSQDLEIHISKGYQLLNGKQAEGVVRFRHNNNGTSYSYKYGDNDIGRMRTQREFIKEVIKQTMKASNITRINQLMNIATEETATNISWDIIKDYIPALLNFDTENLQSDTLPGAAGYYNGVSIYVVNEKEAKEKVQEMFLTTQTSEETANTTSENNVQENAKKTKKKNSEIKIEILNGSGASSKLTNAVEQLQEQGYKVTKKGTTNVTRKTMIIDRKNNSKETENAIKSLLCTGVVSMGEDNSDVDFTIILGTDY